MKLYFKTSKGDMRFISNVENESDAIGKIKDFCFERDFTIPYMRVFGNIDKDGAWYDVGSWSEFFVLKNEHE